jgi:hypothetical protein
MKRQRGQGLVEFAVIFPVFALVLFLVLGGGILMGRYNNINNSAKEAARLGAVAASLPEINTRAQQQAHGQLDTALTGTAACTATSGNRICVQWIPGPGGAPAPGELGSSIRVIIGYEYSLFSGFFGSFPIHMSVCAIQRLEQKVSVPDGHEGNGDSC